MVYGAYSDLSGWWTENKSKLILKMGSRPSSRAGHQGKDQQRILAPTSIRFIWSMRAAAGVPRLVWFSNSWVTVPCFGVSVYLKIRTGLGARGTRDKV